MVSRSTPPGGGGVVTNNSGGTSTTNVGPSSSGSTGTSTSNSRESSSSVRNIQESAARNTSQTTITQNMDSESLAALQALISQLSQGGTAEQQQMADEFLAQIGRSRSQEADYSKQSALNDSAEAAKVQSEQALDRIMPTLTAGIDSAGTSGSAMQALLAQNAANDAAGLAAQLSLETAIQYGNIKNQAMANTTNLLGGLTQVRDQTMDQLLSALNIAKGAVTTQTIRGSEKTNRNVVETTQSQGSSSQSNTSNQVNWNSGQTNTTNTGPTTTTQTTLPPVAGNTQSNLGGQRTNPYVTIV